jgi:hypothetical protein
VKDDARGISSPSAGFARLYILEYDRGMRRITVSLEDALVEAAEADVAAGRAASVSAWVASAMRAKALARAELLADLEALERREPTPPEVVAEVARTLGLPRSVVAGALKRTRTRASTRRAG